MRRRLLLALVVGGLAATAAGLLLAVVGVEPTTPDADPGWFAWLVALGGLGVAAWLLLDRSPAATGDRALPWSARDPIVQERPEATPGRDRLAGGELVEALRDGAGLARDQRDVEAGVAVVRPLLRETYLDVTVRDGTADGEAALDAGTWTDDPVAAWVLSGEQPRPRRSFDRRLRDWLYPGRAVARQVRRAVDELAAVADDAVPPVVGQSAPRQVPVHEPSLAARSVGPVDPNGAVRHRGPPPDDSTSPDSGDRADTDAASTAEDETASADSVGAASEQEADPS